MTDFLSSNLTGQGTIAERIAIQTSCNPFNQPAAAKVGRQLSRPSITPWKIHPLGTMVPSYSQSGPFVGRKPGYLSFRRVLSVEERLATVDGWLDRALAFLPVGWANFTVLFEELKSLDHSQRFIHATPERQIVDDLVANNAIFVDQEQTSERDSVSHQDVIVPGNLFVKVGDQRVVDLSNTALISRGMSPGQMREMAVDGNTDDFHS